MKRKIQKDDIEPQGPVTLAMAKDSARELINKQIDEGEGLLAKQPNSEQALLDLKQSAKEWEDYTKELLGTLFTDRRIRDEFAAFYGAAFRMNANLGERIGYEQDDIRNHVGRLRSILKRLDLFSESTVATTLGSTVQLKSDNRKVFVVHGHNEAAKNAVARLLTQLGFMPIILHEQPNAGQTIIEKFEEHADVGFVVVLLTPDDIGSEKGKESNLLPRARQNVVFEHGYFVGKLGRERVCALVVNNVEIPSDLSGVLYEPMDAGGGWRYKLATEIRAAGFDVDLNLLLGN